MANAQPSSPENIGAQLNWLDGAPSLSCDGITWGVAWPKGQHQPRQQFALETNLGELPLQSWPLAFWPDGSLKWSAHALGPQAQWPTTIHLKPTDSPTTQKQLRVQETAQEILVETGALTCRINKSGSEIFSSLERQGKMMAQGGKLICLKSDQAAPYSKPQEFVGQLSSASIEHSGPVRTVIKLEGKHQNGKRSWLPFTLRLYFYVGSESIRLVHSFVFDGDASQDFIRGLGVRFSVPLHDELYNRHIRFAGQQRGLWAEAIQTVTGLRRDPGEAVRQAQVEGRPAPPFSSWSEPVQRDYEFVPAWGDFSLSQLTSHGFQIRKRTKSGHSWVPAASGQRAVGVGYIGGVSGGVAFGMRDFWQKFPAQLDVTGAASSQAQVDIWMYSPEAPPMDLRPYHDGLEMDTFQKQRRGLDITYEDFEPEFNTPYGVARTTEMNLWVTGATPTRDELADFAATVQNPPLLVAAPEQFLKAQVFGALWSLPDSSTPAKAQIEAQNDYLLALFPQQREQHGWYGFWDYGDWMHSYDSDRHVWKYDVGGFAWANAELSPELWLWYSFLRSGRADIFRLAEAMTRHTSEVDVHHIGRFAGLGSRHNVQHWGDSSKQPRVSSAAYKRFFYFLTADERTGDLLRELLDSDHTVTAIDVGRKLGQDDEVDNAEKPATMALGTSWCSIVAAWLTEWERTGDTKWRDRIEAGMRGIAGMPRAWFTGSGDYNFETGALTSTDPNIGVSHLSAVFGAVEVNAELFQLCDIPAYRAAWLQYCRLYNAPGPEQARELGAPLKKLNLRQAHARLTAFAAHWNKDAALGARAWGEFYGAGAGLPVQTDFPVRHISGPASLNPVDESLGMSTNAASQWGLAAIQTLALAGEWMPNDVATRR